MQEPLAQPAPVRERQSHDRGGEAGTATVEGLPTRRVTPYRTALVTKPRARQESAETSWTSHSNAGLCSTPCQRPHMPADVVPCRPVSLRPGVRARRETEYSAGGFLPGFGTHM